MKKYLILLVILPVLFCLGCNGKHCIKVDGDFGEGKKGGLEYCLDLSGSQKESRLVLNGEGGKTWGLKEEEIKKLLDKIGVNSLAKEGEISLGTRLKEALK